MSCASLRGRFFAAVLFFLAGCVNSLAYGQFVKNDLFVAVNGNNAWSGRLPEPNVQRTDGPVADLPAAVAVLRQRKQDRSLALPVTVWIRGGAYHVAAPLNLGPEDSGAITYAAYPGEQPVFDAGTRITGFREQKLGGIIVWVADVSSLVQKQGAFRSLFVTAQRRPRAHFRKRGR